MIKLTSHADDKGFTRELWNDRSSPDVRQCIFSYTKRGKIRAWYRREQGNNHFTAVTGRVLIVYFDGTKFITDHIESTDPCVEVIPGKYWYGIMALEDTAMICFVSRAHEKENPVELHLPEDNEFEGVGKFNWEKYLL